MRIYYDVPWPMTAGEVATLDQLMVTGKIKPGEHITAARLRELLGCEHPVKPRMNIEKYACPNCLKEN